MTAASGASHDWWRAGGSDELAVAAAAAELEAEQPHGEPDLLLLDVRTTFQELAAHGYPLRLALGLALRLALAPPDCRLLVARAG